MNDQLRKDVNRILLDLYNGDLSAIDQLYVIVSDRMLCVALSYVRDKSLAEEVVQDSFLRIYRHIRLFKRHDNGYAWIMTIVRNLSLNALRREKRHFALDLDEFYNLAAPDKHDSAEANDLIKAMKTLPQDEQQILWYRYYEDMTIRDVAKQMKLAKSTAADLLKKAEAHLKEKL